MHEDQGKHERMNEDRIASLLSEIRDNQREALQPTFFATRYGEVVDRFGIPWEIRCRKAPGSTSG